MSLDGTVWPPDSPDIEVPPLHLNCRSVLVPEVDWEKLGMEPPPEPERAARDLSGAQGLDRKVSARRRTGDLGTAIKVPSSVTAERWLKDQPAAVQDKMLGVGKARLFRDGKITLSDLIRGDLTTVRLDELVGV